MKSKLRLVHIQFDRLDVSFGQVLLELVHKSNPTTDYYLLIKKQKTNIITSIMTLFHR